MSEQAVKTCTRCGMPVPLGSVYCNLCGKKLISEQKKRNVKTRGNGQGTAYRRGNTWTACATVGWVYPEDPTKPKVPDRKTKGGFKTKKEALAYAASMKKDAKVRRRITLEDCWKEWSEPYEARVGKSTFAGYKSAYNHFKSLRGMMMDEIPVTELQKCIDDVEGHRTRQVMKTTSGLLWRYCVAHNILDKDITDVLYLGKGQSVQRDPLTPEEVELIRDRIGKDRYAEYIYCLCYLGYRPGELLELKKDQLHHYVKKDKDGTITADIWYLIAGKKTAAGKDRIMPISSLILDYILDRAMVPGTDLLFPMYQFDRKKEKFQYFKQMRDDYLNKFAFKPMAEALGFSPQKVPYCARHSFADLLKDAEGSEKSKAALMGHSNYLFTQSHYQSDTIEELANLISTFE